MEGIRTATFAPGDVVESKYRIKRLLAEGGMGAVYAAVQEPLGRDVAVKVLKPADDTPEKRAQREKRFFREAAVSSKLNHPNTIVILDYGKLTDQQGFFLVMEFLDGKSLRELLIERGSLGVRLTLHIAMQIAGSLSDAHHQGAVHRDLKPPNVMLVPRGGDPYFVKVVDFGLVKQLQPAEGEEELTSENALVGSPMYMAPERFLSAKADSPAVDVYALGIMMYEMLVGRPPFIREADSTLQQIMIQHVQDVPPPMAKFRPDLDLPDGLEPLVMRCLAKRPNERIQTMDALLTLLRSCAASAGMSVAGRVEDTGAYVRPADGSSESISGDLLPEETGDGTVATVEEPYQRLPSIHDEEKPAIASGEFATTDGKGSRVVGIVAGIAVLVVLGLVGWTLVPTGGETSHLVVNSAPSGATIWIEDRSIGATPFDGAMQFDDSTTVRLEKEGFEPFHYRVSENPGERVIIDAQLERAADHGESAATGPPDDSAADPAREPSGLQESGEPEEPAKSDQAEKPDKSAEKAEKEESPTKTPPKKPTEKRPTDIKLAR